MDENMLIMLSGTITVILPYTGYRNIPKDKGKLSVDKIYSLERNSSVILLLWKKVFDVTPRPALRSATAV